MNTNVFNLSSLIRQNISQMKPYASARDEFKGEADIYLDANENPFPTGYNRYPDPLQWIVKERLSAIKKVNKESIFLGNGSDEAIDLLIRSFCEPNRDSVIITEPTYGMYSVCAAVNAVQVKNCPLTLTFGLDLDLINKTIDTTTKLIFLCSPNNPTGNTLDTSVIERILETFNGLVVVDEAYIDFTTQPSLTTRLSDYPNLVVLQTLSKAWGLASLRLGMCFASLGVITILNKIKYPYNINSETQRLAIQSLNNEAQQKEYVTEIIRERALLIVELSMLPCVIHVYSSEANFLLVQVTDADAIYQYLMQRGIIVRNRSSVINCKNCLRITVGTSKENKKLLNALKNL